MASGAGPCDAIMAATAHQCENGRSSGEEWSEVGSSQSERVVSLDMSHSLL